MEKAVLNFKDKVAIVTGGAMGIGADIAKRFALNGAAVVIADLNDKGEAVAEAWRNEGLRASYVSCDVTSEEDLARLVASAEREFGRIDILVNNAGIFPRGTLLEMEVELWDRILDVNLKGTMLACRAVIPSMIRSGGGSIVNIGSMHHSKGQGDMVAYAVSKGGLVTFTRNLAASCAKHRIRANVVNPGWVLSEGESARIDQAGTREEAERMLGRLPLGGAQTGEDIANAVAFFASELASQITGQVLSVDGGIGVLY